MSTPLSWLTRTAGYSHLPAEPQGSVTVAGRKFPIPQTVSTKDIELNCNDVHSTVDAIRYAEQHHLTEVEYHARTILDTQLTPDNVVPFLNLPDHPDSVKRACGQYIQRSLKTSTHFLFEAVFSDRFRAVVTILTETRNARLLAPMMTYKPETPCGQSQIARLVSKEQFALATKYALLAKACSIALTDYFPELEETLFALLDRSPPSAEIDKLILAIAELRPFKPAVTQAPRSESPLHHLLNKENASADTLGLLLQLCGKEMWGSKVSAGQQLLSLAISKRNVAAVVKLREHCAAHRAQLQDLSSYALESCGQGSLPLIEAVLRFANDKTKISEECMEQVIRQYYINPSIVAKVWECFSPGLAQDRILHFRELVFQDDRFVTLADIFFLRGTFDSSEVIPLEGISWIAKAAQTKPLEWFKVMVSRCKDINALVNVPKLAAITGPCKYPTAPTDGDFVTPLYLVLANGKGSTYVQALLEAGAKVDVPSKLCAHFPQHRGTYFCEERQLVGLRDLFSDDASLHLLATQTAVTNQPQFFSLYFNHNSHALTPQEFKDRLTAIYTGLPAGSREAWRNQNCTMCHAAMAQKRFDEVHSMLSLLPDLLWSTDGATRMPFQMLSGDDRDEAIRYMVQKAIDTKDEELKKNLLFWCAERSHVHFCIELIRARTDCKVSRNQQTLLHLTIEQGTGTEKVFDGLLKLELDWDARDSQGRTALFICVANGSLERARKLLAKGAKPNIPNIQGYTPLHKAVEGGKVPFVRLLVEGGADPQKAYEDKDNALAYAKTINAKQSTESSQAIVTILDEQTCDKVPSCEVQ